MSWLKSSKRKILILYYLVIFRIKCYYLSQILNGSDLIHIYIFKYQEALMVFFLTSMNGIFIYLCSMYSFIWFYCFIFFLFQHTQNFYFMYFPLSIAYHIYDHWCLNYCIHLYYALIYNLYIILLFFLSFFYFHSNYCHRKRKKYKINY